MLERLLLLAILGGPAVLAGCGDDTQPVVSDAAPSADAGVDSAAHPDAQDEP